MQYIDQVGSFTCRVVKPNAGWFGESKEKGTVFLRIPLVVDDADSDQSGHGIVCEKYITEGTQDRLVKDLADVFGITWDDLLALQSGEGEEVPEGITGKLCSIVTESDSYNGKEFIKVKYLNSVDYKPKKADAAKIGSLLQRMTPKGRALSKSISVADSAPTPKPQPKVDAPF